MPMCRQCCISTVTADMAGGYKTSFPYHDQLLNELERWLWSVSVPAPHAVRVACVGNSITYGARLKYRNTESWPAQLQRTMELKAVAR